MTGLEGLGLLGLFIGTFLAATLLPLSSDALYVAVLLATGSKVGCLAMGTLGNWLGGVTTYFIGRLAGWRWIERIFRVREETLRRQKEKIDRYGVWLALLGWVPGIGDVIVLALGFYRTNALWTILLMLVGKLARFVLWTWLFA